MSDLPQIGSTVLGRYVILDVIGIGGEGVVCTARDEHTGQTVAIKVLARLPDGSSSDEQIKRFQRAASLRICHPNVVDPIECIEEQGEWYLVMPFVEGVDLDTYIISLGGRCPVEQTVAIMVALADALAAIHDQGMVHRDIKPLNIIITPDGRPMLIDFGICRKVHEKTISLGGNVGTPCWMSPEQTIDARLVDHRSDQFSLGLVDYYLLTGVPAVKATNADEAMRIVREDNFPAPRLLNPDVPEWLEAVCGRLLSKRPEDRYSNTRDLIRALEQTSADSNLNALCPSCSCPVPEAATFCTTCGASVIPTCMTLCFACGEPTDTGKICPSCKRPFGLTRHRLEFSKGTVAGTTYLVPEGIYEVGRNLICPRDFGISSRQAHVACINGSVFVQDAGSTNKTRVDGKIADLPVLLQPNQSFLIGRNLAVYLC